MFRFFHVDVSDGRLSVSGLVTKWVPQRIGFIAEPDVDRALSEAVWVRKITTESDLNRAIQESRDHEAVLALMVHESLMDTVRIHWERDHPAVALSEDDKQALKKAAEERRKRAQRWGLEMDKEGYARRTDGEIQFRRRWFWILFWFCAAAFMGITLTGDRGGQFVMGAVLFLALVHYIYNAETSRFYKR